MQIVPFQLEFRPELPNIYGTIDYRTFRETLIKIDEILVKSGLENNLISKVLEQQPQVKPGKQADLAYKHSRHALRCNIARHLTGESYRLFSVRLADSTLFQWFTHINSLASRKATSKSALERYEKYFDSALMTDLISRFLAELSDKEKAHPLGLQQEIKFDQIFIDSTCIKAHIHFPVDWVLLRDAARSLLSAIKTIRAQGLKHRMIEPHQLLKQMNKLCIEMTHTRRKKDGNKKRKSILRSMKKLSQCIAKHATRYYDLLIQEWEKTEWSEAQMKQVVGRIDNILTQLPTAIHQAHERVIGERIIKSSEKILSLYDKEADIIVRGKAGNEVEFGQRLILTEQSNGLIIDWELFSKSAPQDNELLNPIINRIESYYGTIESVTTDRGFSSKKNDEYLKTKNIGNAICPKNPTQLKEKLTDPVFVSLQTRRSQTEARIGIFKNVFLGRPLRSRILSNKRHAVNWCVLTHNLWVLSRKALADEQDLSNKHEELKKAA